MVFMVLQQPNQSIVKSPMLKSLESEIHNFINNDSIPNTILEKFQSIFSQFETLGNKDKKNVTDDLTSLINFINNKQSGWIPKIKQVLDAVPNEKTKKELETIFDSSTSTTKPEERGSSVTEIFNPKEPHVFIFFNPTHFSSLSTVGFFLPSNFFSTSSDYEKTKNFLKNLNRLFISLALLESLKSDPNAKHLLAIIANEAIKRAQELCMQSNPDDFQFKNFATLQRIASSDPKSVSENADFYLKDLSGQDVKHKTEQKNNKHVFSIGTYGNINFLGLPFFGSAKLTLVGGDPFLQWNPAYLDTDLSTKIGDIGLGVRTGIYLKDPSLDIFEIDVSFPSTPKGIIPQYPFLVAGFYYQNSTLGKFLLNPENLFGTNPSPIVYFLNYQKMGVSVGGGGALNIGKFLGVYFQIYFMGSLKFGFYRLTLHSNTTNEKHSTPPEKHSTPPKPVGVFEGFFAFSFSLSPSSSSPGPSDLRFTIGGGYYPIDPYQTNPPYSSVGVQFERKPVTINFGLKNYKDDTRFEVGIKIYLNN
ncbi:MAG: hypothetical protein N3D10_00330 [Candidatus Micrarchaeota archaeon]|nr:hypothetical protein [Candidatus Micrarchaeota archaeon]